MNQQSDGKEIANNKLFKLNQEQGQLSSINEEEHFTHQHERNQQDKNSLLTETQNVYHQNERSDLNKQLHLRKLNSIERQKSLGELILDEAKTLKQNKNEQKEIISSTIKNTESTTNKKNSSSYTNLNILQNINVKQASNYDKILYQQKQKNQLSVYQNSFSSLGTISEENTQKSECSQNLISGDRNFTNSSLNLNENEDKTE